MQHKSEEYINEHLLDALRYVNTLIGEKELYTHEDAYKLLNSFSFAQEIEFDEIGDFLPSAMVTPKDIYEYSNGFISNDISSKIYALNYGTGFVIIIISGDSYITSYYGDTINDFTLKIYYCLEIMTKQMYA